ncbi:MAG TPA: mechanosensitive ion channel family protein [Firmicutes bacterium]|nr:mechanosensitive ion channel family protein [Candidatus Fermentithermobacillaceae bacterium]
MNLPDLAQVVYQVGGAALRILLVVVLWAVALKVGDALIGRMFKKPQGIARLGTDDNRTRTLSSLLKSALRYGVSGIAVITILEVLGVDTKALLGGAAILGLAVGFAAQNLVRDIINGFFIIYERQYDIGDYITIAGVSGIVEEVGLRTTKLRDWSGDLHIVPNGLVDKTTNSSVRESRALVEISVAYGEDLKRAITVLQGACDQAAREIANIVEGPKVLGVSKFEDSGVTLLVWARTKPLEQWGVERELRLRLKEALDRAGIEIPFPHVVVIEGKTSKREGSERYKQDGSPCGDEL